ncbi:MAG: hypothetical protein DID91_2727703402 [Candidatus Nitrotoga sp. MKT]|nr:MAG: hypothetical protein DID91_2727703402 [Candidatus Nitrotoga sp. MKT]
MRMEKFQNLQYIPKIMRTPVRTSLMIGFKLMFRENTFTAQKGTLR